MSPKLPPPIFRPSLNLPAMRMSMTLARSSACRAAQRCELAGSRCWLRSEAVGAPRSVKSWRPPDKQSGRHGLRAVKDRPACHAEPQPADRARVPYKARMGMLARSRCVTRPTLLAAPRLWPRLGTPKSGLHAWHWTRPVCELLRVDAVLAELQAGLNSRPPTQSGNMYAWCHDSLALRPCLCTAQQLGQADFKAEQSSRSQVATGV
jgi:hypothetical protein